MFSLFVLISPEVLTNPFSKIYLLNVYSVKTSPVLQVIPLKDYERMLTMCARAWTR